MTHLPSRNTQDQTNGTEESYICLGLAFLGSGPAASLLLPNPFRVSHNLGGVSQRVYESIGLLSLRIIKRAAALHLRAGRQDCIWARSETSLRAHWRLQTKESTSPARAYAGQVDGPWCRRRSGHVQVRAHDCLLFCSLNLPTFRPVWL